MELIAKWAWVLLLIGCVSLVGSASVWWVTGTMDGTATYWAIAGAVALLGYAVFDRDRVGETVSSRSFIYGSGSWLMVVLAGVIAGAAYKVSNDHDKTWDLTTEGSYTLSDHSISIASGIEEPVEILAFYRKGSPDRDNFARLLGRFQEHTDKLTVSYHDPLSSPRMAAEHEVTSDHGTVILSTADGRKKRLEGDITESELTARIILLLSRVEHRICWTIGHGEPDPDDEYSEAGLGQLVLGLEALNYQVTKSLVLTEGVDAACEVLIIASPDSDWQPVEREALAKYVANGGQVVVLIDPFESDELAGELERYGVAVGADLVWDENFENMMAGLDDPSVIVLRRRNFMPHAITSSMGAVVVMSLARSVGPLPDVEGIAVESLLETGFSAWAETNPNGETVEPNPGEKLGDVPLMVVAEIMDPSVLDVPGVMGEAGGRMVVIGDSEFASNALINVGNNKDLLLNTIAWLTKEEAQIGERPSDVDVLEISMPGQALVCLISVIFVPGSTALFGALVLFRRRWL